MNSSPFRQSIQRVKGSIANLNDFTKTGFGRLQSTLSGGLKAAGAGAVGVVGGLVAGFTSATKQGFALNSNLENTTAQLVAFTKDGDKAASILSDIRKEAAATPFEFQAMASASAALLPVAQASGAELMNLVKKAEILAASNPMQGLDGAAFSLREAATGDFTSIIERFNLSRSTINKLKKEGVPNLEIVSRAMQEMGFDADLVAGMAQTLDGRMSTLRDTFDTVQASLAKPVFDFFKSQLVTIQPFLDSHSETINLIATQIGERFTAFLTLVTNRLGGFATRLMEADFTPIVNGFKDGWDYGKQLATTLQVLASRFTPIGVYLMELIPQFVSWKDVLAATGIVLLSVIIPAVGGLIASVVSLAAPVIAVGVALVGTAALIRAAWEGRLGEISTKLQGLGTDIRNWIAAQLPVIKAKFLTWKETATEWLTAAREELPSRAQALKASLVGWAVGQVPAIRATFMNWKETATEWLTAAREALLSRAQALKASLVGWAVGQVPAIRATFMNWKETATEWLTAAREALPARAQALKISFLAWANAQLTQIQTTFAKWGTAVLAWVIPATIDFLAKWPIMLFDFLTWIELAVGPILTSLGEWAIAFVFWVAPMIPDLLLATGAIGLALTLFIGETALVLSAKIVMWTDSFVSWIALDAIPQIALGLIDLGATMGNWVSETVPWLLEEGAKLGSSLLDGILSMLMNAGTKISELLRSAINQGLADVKAAFGIQSPSEVFKNQISIPLMQGIIVGFTSHQKTVGEALQNVVSNAQAELELAPFDAKLKAGSKISKFGGGHDSGHNIQINVKATKGNEEYAAQAMGRALKNALNLAQAEGWA